jgi:hypothetical protein
MTGSKQTEMISTCKRNTTIKNGALKLKLRKIPTGRPRSSKRNENK